MGAMTKTWCTTRTWKRRLLQLVVFGSLGFMFVRMLCPATIYETDYKPCKLFKLNPRDEGMKKYITFRPPLVCAGGKSLLVYMDDAGYLRQNSTAMVEYGVRTMTCEYSVAKPWKYNTREFETPVHMSLPKFVPARLFIVNCYEGDKMIFRFVFTNLVWNATKEMQKQFADETDDEPSIIHFQVDSISRSGAIRKLNLTMPYLKSDLGSYDFEGVARVGVMTKPNLIALQHGHYDSSFDLSWVLDSVIMEHKRFLWDYAAEHEAVTAVMENMLGKFYRKHPFDYFWYRYYISMWTTPPIIMDTLPVDIECYGSRNKFTDNIVYLKRFITKYKGRKKYVFLHSDEITHDVMGVERGDKDMVDFFKWLKVNGHLDKALLIFSSDHGFRIGIDSYTGRLEINNPVLMMRFPPGLIAKHGWMHKNLEHNTKMLMTHYDVHETLKAIITSDHTHEENCPRTVSGHNLFACKLSSLRSCVEAKIPNHFCACDDDAEMIDVSHPTVQEIARRAVVDINEILEPHVSLCRRLELTGVKEARVSYRKEFRTYDHSFIDKLYELRIWLSNLFNKDLSGKYMVVFYTGPNKGEFEVTADFDTVGGIVAMEQPVRLDKYGSQPDCIGDNSFLKQFCLCFDYMS